MIKVGQIKLSNPSCCPKCHIVTFVMMLVLVISMESPFSMSQSLFVIAFASVE